MFIEMDYKKASDLLNSRCYHINYYYNGYGRGGVAVCNQVVAEIKALVAADKAPDQDFIEYYTNYIYYGSKTAKSLYSYYKSCTRSAPVPVIEALNMLLSKTVPKIETMLVFAKENNADAFETIINFHGHKFIGGDAKKLLSNGCTSDKVYPLIINNIDPADKQSFAEFICSSGYYNYIQLYVDKYGIDLTPDMMAGICKYLPNSKAALQYFLSRGLKYSVQCLENASLTGDKNGIKEIMDQRVVPTQKAFRNVIASKKGEYKIIMQLMNYYGYIPTYDDVMYAISFSVELPDIDKYSIKLDIKVLEKCYEIGFHPESYSFHGITPNMQILQTNCANQNISEVKKLIKKHNLVPDKICMESVCNRKQNKPFVTYLVEAGGKMTVDCIRKCAYYMSSNGTLMYIIDEYKKVIDENEKVNKDKIKNLEDEIKSLKERLENMAVAEVKVEAKIDDNVEDVEDENQVDGKDKEKNDSVDLIENSDTEEDPTASSQSNKSENPETIDEADLEAELEDLKEVVEEVMQEVPMKNGKKLVVFPDTIKVPKAPRKKSTPPRRLVKYFGLDKSKKMSYIDVRKFIRDKIKTNKWLLNDDKTLIDLPKGFRKALGISEDGYISHTDIDMIVSLCYTTK